MSQIGQKGDGLLNRQTVGASASEVVHLPAARRSEELQKQARYVAGMNLIPNLFAFITIDCLFETLHGTGRDIRQISMHFDGGMLRSGHAAGPENAHRHLEGPPELLTKNTGSQF